MLQMIVLILLISYSTYANAYDKILLFSLGSSHHKISSIASDKNFDINTEAGVSLTGGIILPVNDSRPHAFETQLTFGMKVDDQNDPPNQIEWFRFPFEVAYLYRNYLNNFRVGYGYVYQINDKINAKGTNSSKTTEIDNSSGPVLLFEKLFPSDQPDVYPLFGLKYTHLKFRNSKTGESITSDGLSLSCGAIF